MLNTTQYNAPPATLESAPNETLAEVKQALIAYYRYRRNWRQFIVHLPDGSSMRLRDLCASASHEQETETFLRVEPQTEQKSSPRLYRIA